MRAMQPDMRTEVVIGQPLVVFSSFPFIHRDSCFQKFGDHGHKPLIRHLVTN